ncbi:DUF1653 domain-containing protein [Enterocloster clostridioformis]
MVICQALYGEFGTFARPADMFFSEADREKRQSRSCAVSRN